MINFHPFIQHKVGSKSELYRLVMLKHLDFQKKYLNEEVTYPAFISLEQFQIEASFNMDITSAQDAHEVNCLKSLAGYRKLLKEITASVTTTYTPSFDMTEKYLSSLDEMIELQLVSNGLAFIQNFIADWNTSHCDIHQFARSLSTLVIFKNPFLDFNDEKLLHSLINHNAHLLNELAEHPFSTYVLNKIIDRIKNVVNLTNIPSEILDLAKSEYRFGFPVIINNIDFNMSATQLNDLYKKICTAWMYTEDPESNIITSTFNLLRQNGVEHKDINSLMFFECIRQNFYRLLSQDADLTAVLHNTMHNSCSRALLGFIANTFSHQFIFQEFKDQTASIQVVPLNYSLKDTKKWTESLLAYIHHMCNNYDLDQAKAEDIQKVLSSFTVLIESYHVDGSKFEKEMLNQVVNEYLTYNQEKGFFIVDTHNITYS